MISKQQYALDAIDIILCFLIPLPYIVQCRRIIFNGTAGIHSRFILYSCLFTTAQLSSRIVNPDANILIHKNVVNGTFRGWQAFTALTLYFQVLIQWICSIVLLTIFIKYRTYPTDRNALPATTVTESDSTEAATEIQAIPTSSYSEIPSMKMVTILIIEAGVLFNAVLPLFFMPISDTDKDPGGAVLQSLVEIAVHWILIVTSFVLAALQFTHQIGLLASAREPQNLSTLALGMNVPLLLLLAVMQTLRAGTEHPMRYGFYLRGWFSRRGNVPVNYIITALGDMILLGLCLRLGNRRVVLE